MRELQVMTFDSSTYAKRNEEEAIRRQKELERKKRARRRRIAKRRRNTIITVCYFSLFAIVAILIGLILSFVFGGQNDSSDSVAINIEEMKVDITKIPEPLTIETNNSEQVLKAPETTLISYEEIPLDNFSSAVSNNSFYRDDVPLDNDLQQYIYDTSQEYNVDVDLVIAVIKHESDFDPNARSESGDSGLMQVNDLNLDMLKEKLGITDIYDPYQNVLSGIYLLSKCLKDTNGEVHLALMCYNMGKSNAEKCWAKGIYSSKYSRAVNYIYTGEYY